MELKQGLNGAWKTRWTFILAAAGSAIGLGNIWKFPYIAGENGGGAFILVYLVCIALIGIPIMMAEVLLGYRSRMSPINAMLYLSRESGVSHRWAVVGWSGVLAGILILSFYSVVAGWAIHYFTLAITKGFVNIDSKASNELFRHLLTNPKTLIIWHSIFLVITLIIVAAGVIRGLGIAIRYLMPLLFVLLGALVFYSTSIGNFPKALDFMFSFNSGALTWDSILVAMGHAFFTLSLGMGAIMTYGAYLPREDGHATFSLGKIVLIIAFLDTAVALAAGLVIFPIVFANPVLQPGEGPGLLFISLPVAFGGMVSGSWFAAAFFFLIFIAALSSAISLIEPTVAWLVERRGYRRWKITFSLGVIIWLLGLVTVFSFNHWSEITIFGNTFFENLDFLTANVMLPLGGLLIAVFVGWFMKKAVVAEETGNFQNSAYQWWYFVLLYISPVLVGIVFIANFFQNWESVSAVDTIKATQILLLAFLIGIFYKHPLKTLLQGLGLLLFIGACVFLIISWLLGVGTFGYFKLSIPFYLLVWASWITYTIEAKLDNI
ncbi:MAG: NSS family neurotransmitter:Na+ symporter [Cellvibrionaceae bacterium]|jgi:NSS family neurotransmitter:Na+ symporter